jgi:hypothetical protein
MKCERIYLHLIQDDIPEHRAGEIKQDLEEKSIQVIEWPAFSPD